MVETLQRLKFTLVSMGDKVVKLEHKGKIVEIEENTSFSDLGEKKYAPFAEITNKKDRYKSWELMQTEYKEGEPLINDINSFKNLLLSYTESNSSITIHLIQLLIYLM